MTPILTLCVKGSDPTASPKKFLKFMQADYFKIWSLFWYFSASKKKWQCNMFYVGLAAPNGELIPTNDVTVRKT